MANSLQEGEMKVLKAPMKAVIKMDDKLFAYTKPIGWYEVGEFDKNEHIFPVSKKLQKQFDIFWDKYSTAKAMGKEDKFLVDEQKKKKKKKGVMGAKDPFFSDAINPAGATAPDFPQLQEIFFNNIKNEVRNT